MDCRCFMKLSVNVTFISIPFVFPKAVLFGSFFFLLSLIKFREHRGIVCFFYTSVPQRQLENLLLSDKKNRIKISCFLFHSSGSVHSAWHHRKWSLDPVQWSIFFLFISSQSQCFRSCICNFKCYPKEKYGWL